jgi:hypothetical protein
MPDYYIEYLGGAAKVDRYVGVSGVKHGTTLHGVGTFFTTFSSLFPGAPDPSAGSCGSCNEFLVGSDYIAKIEARAPARRDLRTSPRSTTSSSSYTSSFWPPESRTSRCGTTAPRLQRSPRSSQPDHRSHILNALILNTHGRSRAPRASCG